MRVGAFELDEPIPEVKESHALALLRPWVDVGNVGTLTIGWLESHFQSRELARLAKPGDFFDFTRYRPSIYSQGNVRRVVIPNTFITYSQQKNGPDFLFLHLLEPHSHAERYIDSIVRLLAKFNVKRYCLIGSMYDYVPHTKPLLVTGRASDDQTQHQLESIGIGSSDYEGPTSISFLISQIAPSIGMETSSLIVHLPQYAQLDDDYIGTAHLIKTLGALYDIPQNDSYLRRAEKQIKQIDVALQQNPQLKTIIQELENHYDSRDKAKKEGETPKLSPEIEKFLAEMDKRFREG